MIDRWGAYGFSFDGVRDRLLTDFPRAWLTVEIGQHPLGSKPSRTTTGGLEVKLLGGGSVIIETDPRRASFFVPETIASEALAHPYLAPVATAHAYWCGYETFHAGGFVTDGKVWAIAATRARGKSSTLAALAAAGYPIVADDLLVLAGDRVFAGPRSLDLREDAAAHFAGAKKLGMTGGRERWRLDPGKVKPVHALGGWILLDWDTTLRSQRVAPADRVRQLSDHRAIGAPVRDPAQLMRLAAFPMWRVVRPRSWDATPSVIELIEAITAD